MGNNEIIDEAGQNRLTLTYEPEGKGANFASLAWAVKKKGQWENLVVITRSDFQAGAKYRRWVSEVHNFAPSKGTAIIKVAEGDAPERDPKGVHYHYSWREWDLQKNRELRFFYSCENPFAKYVPTA